MSPGNRRRTKKAPDPLSSITLKLLSAFKDTDFSLATRAPNLCSHENTSFVQLLQAIKKIMFQCQVYKQHPCPIMFKEIIPTRGCSSLLNKSFSRMCTYVSFFKYIMFFSAQFCVKHNVPQIQSPCPN